MKLYAARKAFLLGYACALGMQYARRLAYDADFQESEHHRDKDGKFAKSGSGKGVEDISSLLTPEIKGVKGKAAIDAITKAGKGYVRGAFHREDIGDIDLFWGDDNIGLKHILRRRKEQNIELEPFLGSLTDTIEKGKLQVNNEGNFEIWHNGNTAVVYPSFKGNKLTFVCTAYKQRKPSKNLKAFNGVQDGRLSFRSPSSIALV
ncbi:MAG: hypothetical protein NC112_09065 [Oxalobacter formigenes]|nr:hypothetical protein [Oxalobacter formigenes]